MDYGNLINTFIGMLVGAPLVALIIVGVMGVGMVVGIHISKFGLVEVTDKNFYSKKGRNTIR